MFPVASGKPGEKTGTFICWICRFSMLQYKRSLSRALHIVLIVHFLYFMSFLFLHRPNIWSCYGIAWFRILFSFWNTAKVSFTSAWVECCELKFFSWNRHRTGPGFTRTTMWFFKVFFVTDKVVFNWLS